jgi:GNAT superfamily N-acetyltransferase
VSLLLGTSTTYRRQRGSFTVHADRDEIDLDAVFAFLSTAPWAPGLTREALECSIQQSLCFSLFEDAVQIGFARIITDYVTYGYLCDVFVIESRRSRGLGSWLVRCALEHPTTAGLKRVALITHNAQEFYIDLGFQFATCPNRYMERLIQNDITGGLRP